MSVPGWSPGAERRTLTVLADLEGVLAGGLAPREVRRAAQLLEQGAEHRGLGGDGIRRGQLLRLILEGPKRQGQLQERGVRRSAKTRSTKSAPTRTMGSSR